MKKLDLKKYNLPDGPGIYEFRDGENVLYIGKATSLRDRVTSYFSNDLISARGQRIVQMVERSNNLNWHETDSVLEALILETNLIKKLQPPYNVREKDGKSFNYVVITDEDWPRVFAERGRNLLDRGQLPYKIKYVFGPFPQGGVLKEALKIIREIFTFRDRRAVNETHERFYRQLELSPDMSTVGARKEYGLKIQNIKRIFQGKKKLALKDLGRSMNQAAKFQEFEKAAKIRQQIYALEHIRDVSLIKNDLYKERVGESFRIEAYDVAHISGTNTVGVMTVVDGGEVDRAEYRLFNIRSKTRGNDILALKELLGRRLTHPEWGWPQMVVVDGGVAQYNLAREVLVDFNMDIPVVAVTKDERHRPSSIKGEGKIIREHERDILLANSEAHRFSITAHRKKRGKIA